MSGSDSPETFTANGGRIPDLREVAGTYDVQRRSGNGGPTRAYTPGGSPTAGELGFALDGEHELTPAVPVPGGIGEFQSNPSADPARGRASRQEFAGQGSARGANGADVSAGWRVGGEARG